MKNYAISSWIVNNIPVDEAVEELAVSGFSKIEISGSESGLVKAWEDNPVSICDKLNIPFEQLDLRKAFKQYVIDPFLQDYYKGLTPNPCIYCNRFIKFGFLFDHLTTSAADYLATGHYALIEQHASIYHLMRAHNKRKDQTYFLYMLSQKKLEKILFPLGTLTDSELGSVMKEIDLPTLEKSSQDLCFISSKEKCHHYLLRHYASETGDIVNLQGEIIGKHKGTWFYTIGQRHGIGIADKHPLYIVKKDRIRNILYVGEESKLYTNTCVVKEINWVAEKPASSVTVLSQIRYHAKPVESRLTFRGDSIHVHFQEAQRAVTPGQAIVFYKDNEILGGGIIEESAYPF